MNQKVVFIILSVIYLEVSKGNITDCNIKEIIMLEGNSYGFVYITQVADKVAELRAAHIFTEITQPNWIYLASFIVILFIVLIAMCSFRTPAVCACDNRRRQWYTALVCYLA